MCTISTVAPVFGPSHPPLATYMALQVIHCSREHGDVHMPCVCVEHTARSHVEAITSLRVRASRTLMLRLLLCAGPRDAVPGTAGANPQVVNFVKECVCKKMCSL